MPPSKDAAGSRIALIGLPGAGKTTVGRLLAEELGWMFSDCDAAFETETGGRIADWVATNGWLAFRAREHELLASALGRTKIVIASGGGAVEEVGNRTALAVATVVWLDAPPAVLAERLGAASDRPLLADAPAARIAELSDRRKSLYAALADVRTDVADCDPPGATARIMQALNFKRLIP